MPPFQAGFSPADSTQPSSRGLKPCSCPAPASPCAQQGRKISTPRPCWQLGGLCLAPRPLPAPLLLATGAALRLRLHPSHPCLSPHPSSRCVLVQSTSFPPPPPPCPRGFSLGSPGSASSALVPSPNLPGCAERGGAGCCRRGACSLCCPPNPRTMPPDVRETPISLGGGGSESHKKSAGMIRAWLPPQGVRDGGEQPGTQGEDLVPASHPNLHRAWGGDAQQGTWGGNGRSGGCCEARSSA